MESKNETHTFRYPKCLNDNHELSLHGLHKGTQNIQNQTHPIYNKAEDLIAYVTMNGIFYDELKILDKTYSKILKEIYKVDSI